MKSGSALTSMALVACLAMLVSGAGSWLMFGQDKVTRGEMKEYVSEKLLPVGRLERNVEKISELQQELLVEQRVLVERLNLYLESR